MSTSDDAAAGHVTGRGAHAAAVSVCDTVFGFTVCVDTAADFCAGTSGFDGTTGAA
ncbi:hypothetical protein AB0K00_10300 [Dactylosporangium sp. NPDC049525]|uniref:hypothetical protein n=1 Tax=Dactylosporangium sp. NPDC049525 TaxID=3154730 RepID=UPI0034381269